MLKKDYQELSDIDKEIMVKKDYIVNMIDYLKLDAFFSEADLKNMIKNNDLAGKQLLENTQKIKIIYEFIVKLLWEKQLEGNKRLARKILDSVKVYERPELTA